VPASVAIDVKDVVRVDVEVTSRVAPDPSRSDVMVDRLVALVGIELDTAELASSPVDVGVASTGALDNGDRRGAPTARFVSDPRCATLGASPTTRGVVSATTPTSGVACAPRAGATTALVDESVPPELPVIAELTALGTESAGTSPVACAASPVRVASCVNV
jgi:hypothetical protein